MYIPIPYQLNPRHYQREILEATQQAINVLSVIHRRAGKDTISLQVILTRALQRVGTHIYLAPLLTQIRQIIWQGMTHTGKPFISYIPEILIASKNEARMEIKLVNGSVIKFAGSNNFNGLMGTNPVTILYSEYSLHNPLARQYLNPILVENGGFEMVQCTPRGMNHAYEMMQAVQDNPKYLVQVLGVDKTYKDDGSPVITKEQIEDARKMGMSDEMIRQEFYCDFEVGNVGAYFTREMTQLLADGRYTQLKADPRLPLHSCWDLGSSDATAGWLFQCVGHYIHLLHLVHGAEQGLKHHLEEAERYRQSVGCKWGHHFMPHDIDQEHQGWEHVQSRLIQARQHGWHFLITPKVAINDGIEQMRYVLERTRINKPNCDLGIRGLREYQRKFDEVKGVFDQKPMHNWASDIADAFRYLSINYRRLFELPQSPKSYDYIS